MNSIVEAKVRGYLQDRLRYDPYECGAIVKNMRSLARTAGHDLDERFARSGLGSGPEGRVAAGIVELALGGGGSETSGYTIRKEIARWLRTTPQTGALG